MKRKLCIIVLSIMLISGCGHQKVATRQVKVNYRTSLSPENELTIAYRPQPAKVSEGEINLNTYPELTYYDNYDVRGKNLSKLNLKDKFEQLLITSFDSNTEWGNNLPENFDPDKILEQGKTPGLGIKQLHKQGYDGEGVSVAFVGFDELLTEHEEYKDQLKLYEEIHARYDSATLFGTGVASLAVGKTTGIAPKANLYYIACFGAKYIDNKFTRDNNYIAAAVSRLVQVNQTLPSAEKIRVMAVSFDTSPKILGQKELQSALDDARNSGIYVLENQVFSYSAIHRDPFLDPDKMESYRIQKFPKRMSHNTNSLYFYIPTANKTLASPTGASDYTYFNEIVFDFNSAYILGLYALAYQINPEIDDFEFHRALRESGELYLENNKDKIYYVINPVEFIKIIQDGAKE